MILLVGDASELSRSHAGANQSSFFDFKPGFDEMFDSLQKFYEMSIFDFWSVLSPRPLMPKNKQHEAIVGTNMQ